MAENKADWVIHYVFDDNGIGGIVNIHTHGMDKYNHPDFQLVLPVSQAQAKSFLNAICYEVQDGSSFGPGIYDKETVYSCSFALTPRTEAGRDVLRLIFPDSKMRFPDNPLCEEPYKFQTQEVGGQRRQRNHK